jgi:hypothetical protein
LPVPVPASTIKVFSLPSRLPAASLAAASAAAAADASPSRPLQAPCRALLRLEHRRLGHGPARCFHRGGDRARHLDLRGTRAVAVNLACQQAVGGENVVEFGFAAGVQRGRKRAPGGAWLACGSVVIRRTARRRNKR